MISLITRILKLCQFITFLFQGTKAFSAQYYVNSNLRKCLEVRGGGDICFVGKKTQGEIDIGLVSWALKIGLFFCTVTTCYSRKTTGPSVKSSYLLAKCVSPFSEFLFFHEMRALINFQYVLQYEGCMILQVDPCYSLKGQPKTS